MITQIDVANVATFSTAKQEMSDLRPVNYIYGGNGSGKTTISRIIANPQPLAECHVYWEDNSEKDRYVYNKDFVEQNFEEQLQGIFTLGETDAETEREIASVKADIARLEHKILNLQVNLDGDECRIGKRQEEKQEWRVLCEQLWDSKKIYDEYFSNVLKGARGGKQDFANRVLKEYSNNSSEHVSFEALKDRAQRVLSDNASKVTKIDNLSVTNISSIEDERVFSEKIFGQEDVDIAQLIKTLGNSDWVREGVKYLEQSEGFCPFCQQRILFDLKSKMEAFFDENYTQNVERIRHLYSQYAKEFEQIESRIINIRENYSDYIQVSRFVELEAHIHNVCRQNLQVIEQKLKEPGRALSIRESRSYFDDLNALIDTANESIEEHNRIVDNIDKEKEKLSDEVWKSIVEERRATVEAYLRKQRDIEKAISGMNQSIQQKRLELNDLRLRLGDLESCITSVQPTVDAINRILQSFGFQNFYLKVSDRKENFYEIVRPEGTDASSTLSEGEKTFITFLYFYYLVRGSQNQSGTSSDRVVVFDDPVSSLDGDVLFIVSNLIKDVVREVRSSQSSNLKQVFCLTHNVYFHKEVTFDPERRGASRGDESFWIVRKKEGASNLARYESNPIKTAYEMLWKQVRESDNEDSVTIQNIMRRILENYFEILGNWRKDDIVNRFDGIDRQVCNSLFSWINDGSHWAQDDLYVSCDPETIERYLRVFKEIFVRTDNIGHYNMMMGVIPTEKDPG